MYKLLFFLLTLPCLTSFAQNKALPAPEKAVAFDGKHELTYDLFLKKNNTYLLKVYQENIDVELTLCDSARRKIVSTDLADGNKGYDKLEYVAQRSARYLLTITSVSPQPVANGIVRVSVTALSKAEVKRRKTITQELADENAKAVTTVDIAHFWQAYDKLGQCRTYADSVHVIQAEYLDRATNGLREFQRVRYFSAEFYVERIRKYKKFYESVRANTLLFLHTAKLAEVIATTRALYPAGKPAKVALTIGPMSSGGTLSNNYVLIGLEMLAGDKTCTVSEITNENLKTDILSRANQADVLQFVEETIAHEYIHTQQKALSQQACQCVLLENVLKEGVASFISEKLVMKRPQETASRAARYATANEKALWLEMKGELCSKSVQNWLFNAASSKARPGDLGYRLGYKIAEAYYTKATDKDAAVREMIEMDNALTFLDKSGYDVKFR